MRKRNFKSFTLNKECISKVNELNSSNIQELKAIYGGKQQATWSVCCDVPVN